MQGFVNHLFPNGEAPLVGREKVQIWERKLYVVSSDHHDDIFTVIQLLKNPDLVFDTESWKNSQWYLSSLPFEL